MSKPTPKKEPRYLLGMKTAVETPKGSDRSGTDPEGNKWSVKLKADYGHINGTRGADKDHIDAFFGPDAANGDLPVHVIDQQNEDGSFDEHKVMLGYRTAEEATKAYHANYEPGFRGFADVTPMKLGDFKAWAFAPGPRSAPAAEDATLNFAEGGLVQTLKDKLWGTKEERQKKLTEKFNTQQLQPVERLSTYTNGTATAERMKAVDKYAAGGLVQAYGARKWPR